MWKKSDKFNYNNYNNILLRIVDIYQSIFNDVISLEQKKLGDFLFSEDLNNIENYIYKMAEIQGINFDKKEWYNMTTISFLDVNRWETSLDLIEEDIEDDNLIYPSDELYPDDELYMLENHESEKYCNLIYCGEEYLL